MAGILRAAGKMASRLGFSPGTGRQVRRIASRAASAKGGLLRKTITGDISPAARVKSTAHQMQRVAKVNKMVKRINTKRAVVGSTLGAATTGGLIYGLHRPDRRVKGKK